MTLFSRKALKPALIVGCALVAALTICPQPAHAGYLDPGSGSTAVQWIVASVAALSRVKRQIIDTISNIFSR